MPKLKLFWKGALMRFATGFWVSLASSSALLDSGSLAGSAAFPTLIATLSKTAQKSQETEVIREAFIDSFFIVVPRTFMAIARSAIRAGPTRLKQGGSADSTLRLARRANQRREDGLGHSVKHH